MIKAQLGRFQRVSARDVFAHEGLDFTPWLAEEENLQLLSEALNMPLCLEAVEQPVGMFRADLLCKNQQTGDWVLVENQLERTDHTHLGQILTYASGLKAVTTVWIAGQFTDEHRAALDWLNEITVQGIQFIGVEIEFWRIGMSDVAPKFNVVSMPNTWTKEVSREVSNLKTGRFNTRGFVFACLESNPNLKLAEIEQMALAQGLNISQPTISRHRKQFFEQNPPTESSAM